MPDSPVDHSIGGERGFNTAFVQSFLLGFFGLIIIHERIQRYIIACNELNMKKNVGM